MKMIWLVLLGMVCAYPFGLQNTDKNWVSEGTFWFEHRNEKSRGSVADSVNILKAIHSYEKGLQNESEKVFAAEKLLEARWFYGAYVLQNREQKKSWYKESFRIAQKYMKENSQNPGFSYWYAVHLGLWANEVGFVKLVTKGVAEKILNAIHHTEKLNPKYENGGTYFMLGSLYHITPYIPFYTDWASNKKAEEYIRKGLMYEPQSFAGKYFLARIYYETNRKEESLKLMRKIIHLVPREKRKVEDREIQKRSLEFLSAHL